MEPINLNDMLDFNEKLNKLIDTRANKLIKSQPEEPYESEQINELATALSKAQGEFIPVVPNKRSKYWDQPYADLEVVLRALEPILSKQGLSITQHTELTKENISMLVTKLRHASGQWTKSCIRIIPPKEDIDTYTSTVDCMRRNQILALLGCSVSGDDDNGDIAMKPFRQGFEKGVSLDAKYDPQENSSNTITKDHLEELEYELAEYTDIGEDILKRMRLQSLADIPESKYRATITKIREIKMLRNGEKK